MNFMIYPMGMLGFYLCGFAFMFGGMGPIATMGAYGGLNHEFTITLFGKTFGLLGLKGFMLQGAGYDTAAFALFLFQMVFMDTTATIPTGGAAERWKFSAFMIYGCFIGTVMYPIFGNWVWGGGWLSQLGTTLGLGHGYVDFAGSTVVHAVGGFAAMALAVILGPRIGKYTADGKPRAFPAHNVVFVVTGTFILLFGWMGFNPGSTLGATDLRISVIAINTNLAAVAGAASAMTVWYFVFGKPDISMACNGMLAGLVAITAPCAFVGANAAVVIGIIAGMIVCGGVLFNERLLHVDDPCGAISVHGYCGWWGAVALGIFADGTYGAGWNGIGTTRYLNITGQGVTGLLYGDTTQFITQILGATLMAAYAFGFTFAVFKIVNAVRSLRVSAAVELEGLDVPEFGLPAYPEDMVVGAEA